MAFLESSAFFGGVRERLFAFQTREAVASLWRDCDRSFYGRAALKCAVRPPP